MRGDGDQPFAFACREAAAMRTGSSEDEVPMPRYATPATRPLLPDIGALAVNNNGSGTTGGVTPLALVAQ